MSYKTLRGALAVLAALGASAASASPSSSTSPPRVNVPEPADPPMLQSVVVPAPAAAPPPPAPPRSGKERSATPLGTPAAWVTTNDYPKTALREGRSGVVGFRLNIGIDGRVTGCTILTSSGSPDLDEATCALVSHRAVFSPALNAKGKPTQGTYASRVRWVVPNNGSEAEALVPESRTMVFIVEVSGAATGCAELRNGKPSTVLPERSPCSLNSYFKPFLDSKGRPVRKRVKITFDLTVSDAP